MAAKQTSAAAGFAGLIVIVFVVILVSGVINSIVGH